MQQNVARMVGVEVLWGREHLNRIVLWRNAFKFEIFGSTAKPDGLGVFRWHYNELRTGIECLVTMQNASKYTP